MPVDKSEQSASGRYARRMNERTAEIILDCVGFFGLSDDSAVDPDDAVKMLESLAARLQRLEWADQRVLIEAAARRSAAATDPKAKEFYAKLPEYLGLGEYSR
jgi:hypothetical protein